MIFSRGFDNFAGFDNPMTQERHAGKYKQFQSPPLVLVYTRQTDSAYVRDQHRLVLTILQHIMVGVVTDGENVRWHFTSLLSFEHLNNLLGVDGETTVWVHSNTEKARVGLEMIEVRL